MCVFLQIVVHLVCKQFSIRRFLETRADLSFFLARIGNVKVLGLIMSFYTNLVSFSSDVADWWNKFLLFDRTR